MASQCETALELARFDAERDATRCWPCRAGASYQQRRRPEGEARLVHLEPMR